MRTHFEAFHSLPTRERFVEVILLLCSLYYRFKEVLLLLLLLNMGLQLLLQRLMVFMLFNRTMNIDKLSFELKEHEFPFARMLFGGGDCCLFPSLPFLCLEV